MAAPTGASIPTVAFFCRWPGSVSRSSRMVGKGIAAARAAPILEAYRKLFGYADPRAHGVCTPANFVMSGSRAEFDENMNVPIAMAATWRWGHSSPRNAQRHGSVESIALGRGDLIGCLRDRRQVVDAHFQCRCRQEGPQRSRHCQTAGRFSKAELSRAQELGPYINGLPSVEGRSGNLEASQAAAETVGHQNQRSPHRVRKARGAIPTARRGPHP